MFYQRKDADGAGEPDVERLFFATLVSTKTADLTLEGLPLYAQDLGQSRRRSLNGFRRSLRQLERDYPDHGVFVEDKTQGRFEEELASRAGVARTTVARMETLAKGDMSVSGLVRLLEAVGYDLKAVKQGHARTLEDILAEQRRGDGE